MLACCYGLARVEGGCLPRKNHTAARSCGRGGDGDAVRSAKGGVRFAASSEQPYETRLYV